MKVSNGLLQYLRTAARGWSGPCASHLCKPSRYGGLQHRSNPRSLLHRRFQHQRIDDPDFISLVDQPQQLVSTNKKHGLGLVVLAIIPVTAFALGTWQVQRLAWKSDLIARFEDRLIREPLPLPPRIDPDVVHEFDYRRVYAKGRLRHDQEILIGPRIHDGENGYLITTPLERDDGSKILVSRGWISKGKVKQEDRTEGLPQGQVVVQGLLREPFKKNMFTPENHPEKGEWYFPDVVQMAEVTGSQPVWIEETMEPDLRTSWEREAKGIPIGRIAEVNLRNNHTQYIFTWYSLSLATAVMFYMVVRKPPSSIANRVRHSRQW